MRKIIVSGLNQNVGMRSAFHLASDNDEVTGIVRSKELFSRQIKDIIGAPTARLIEYDLWRNSGEAPLQDSQKYDVGFYFTEVPTLADHLNLGMESIAITNFVKLCQKYHCRRIVYIARLMDERFIEPVRRLLEELRVQYTIVIKSSTIGQGTVFNRVFEKFSHKQVLFYWQKIANLEFRPVPILDVYRWLREMPWENRFISEVLYFGGDEKVTVRQVYDYYLEAFSLKNLKEIPLNKALAKWFFYKIYHLQDADMDEFRRIMHFEKNINNAQWADVKSFKFSPLQSCFSLDQ